MIGRARLGLLIIGGLLSASLAAVLLGQAASPPAQSGAGLQVRELEVRPAIVLSGEPVTMRAVVRNGGTRPLRSIFTGMAVATDLAPGLRWSAGPDSAVRGLPVLAPGAEITVSTSLTPRGDGWIRLGIVAWSAEDTLPPVTHRVLVVDPVFSALELVVLLAMLASIAAPSVALLALLRRGWLRRSLSRNWKLSAAVLLFLSAAAIWSAASLSFEALEPGALRLLSYGGVLLFAAGWILGVGLIWDASPRRRVLAAVGLYATVGCCWIVLFYTWLGVRPTLIARSPEFWNEAIVWPLHLAQAIFGLHFG